MLVASTSAHAATPPVLTKAFGIASIRLHDSTTLTFTVQNNNTTAALSGIAFTDSLPAGLVVATPNGLTGSCGAGTITTGRNSIALISGTLPANSSCAFSVNVIGTAFGQQNNTTGNVTSTEGGTGGTASASLVVEGPPAIAKTFNPASIGVNGVSTLTLTITNPVANTAALTGVAVTDSLPAGLVVATPNALVNTCGGTATATSGSGSVSLTGGTVATNGTCTMTVNVTSSAAGSYVNTTGAVSSTNGTGNSASATLSVVTPPSITKAFGAASMPLNGTTTLTFTLGNPNVSTALTALEFTDNLPAGLVVAAPNGLVNTCGGTATAPSGSDGVFLAGGTLTANSSCSVAVKVLGVTPGVKPNSVTVAANESGVGNTSNASVTVVGPPTIAKTFGAASIPLNGSTSLSFTVQNINPTVPLSGIAFTDSLPAGLVVATPNGLTGSCGGGNVTATAGSSSVSLTGASLASSASCTFSVKVKGVSAGVENNTTGPISANESGVGSTSNTASITVIGSPTISKAFGAASIPLNGTTTLSFTLNSPNATVALSNVAFTDTLPAGLVVATPNGLTGSCGGGTIAAAAGSGSVTLSGATLAAAASCTFSVNVTGTTSGAKNNTTGTVTSTQGGTGGTASASINVVGGPVIAKAFAPASIAVNGVSVLTLTISNAGGNPTALSGVAVTDALPSGMLVAAPNGLVNTCGGTAIATAGSGSVTLAGGTVPTSGACTISVNVTSSAAGSYVNTTGAVSSTNGGTGNTATATLTVQPADLTITETHAGSFSPGQSGASYTITVSNGGLGPTMGVVTVVDTLPAIPNTLVPTAMSGTGWSCTLATLTCTRSDALAAGASYPAITLTVNVPANIQLSFTNTATVSGGGEANTANDTASDPATIVFTSFTGPTATGTGDATVSFTGGGPTCTFAPQGSGALQSAFFIPVSGSPKSPAAPPPAGVTFPEGLLDFVLLACDGSPVTFTVTYPNALPSGLVYWKFGPTADNGSPHWYQLPATFGTSSATFTITDGGLGDDDLAANGTIVDQGGPGTPGPGTATPVPTLDERALALLALALLAFGIHRSRQRRGADE